MKYETYRVVEISIWRGECQVPISFSLVLKSNHKTLYGTDKICLHDLLYQIFFSTFLCFSNKQDDPELSEFALDGLKQVMAVKSKSVLPFLVPKLTASPVNIKALAILSSVAGEALIKHLEKILPAMIQAVHVAEDGGEKVFVILLLHCKRNSLVKKLLCYHLTSLDLLKK